MGCRSGNRTHPHEPFGEGGSYDFPNIVVIQWLEEFGKVFPVAWSRPGSDTERRDALSTNNGEDGCILLLRAVGIYQFVNRLEGYMLLHHGHC